MLQISIRMNARQSMEQKDTQFTNTGNKANVTMTSCDGMQPTRLNRTTSHLVPTLVALLPALAHTTVLVRTHWHVRVPVLCNCGTKCLSTNMLTQQAFEPLIDHDFEKQVVQNFDLARLLKRAGSNKIFEPFLS